MTASSDVTDVSVPSGPALSSEQRNRLIAHVAIVLASLTLLYWNVIVKLVNDWSTDDNYSHGFLIVPLALYLAWERRHQVLALSLKPSPLGLLIVVASIAVLAAGTLGAELFLARISMIGVLVGAIVFLAGWQHLRVLVFPVAFLLLMVPMPAIIFNQITFPLQLLASQAGEFGLSALNIPVLREGNIIVLAHTKLEVVEACSGIRSLVSLLTLGIVYSYFVDDRAPVRWAISLSAIPVAIVSNAMRIAGTGVAAHYYGVEAAEGFFHSFSGWVVFVVAFAAILGVKQLVVQMADVTTRLRLGGAHA
jgi:exosortase